MEYQHNNGGNPKGVSDCVARAIAISLNRPYYDVAQGLAHYTQEGGVNVWATGFLDYMEAQGFRYVEAFPLSLVSRMPSDCIAHCVNHYTAVVAGVVNDTLDTRLEVVRGYWVKGNRFNVIDLRGMAKNSAPMNFAQAVAMRRLLNLNYSTLTEIQSI